MVEFYAWVDDHLRTICGLTQETTCWQVVEALCEATGKKGQHLLWEVWRDFGRPISPRESVVSLMRQWGQELPTVRFVLRSKEEGSLVKRRALSRKHKLFYYTEEQKIQNHKPKRKIHKSYTKTDPKNIILREYRQLNYRIGETMRRLRCTESTMDILLEDRVTAAFNAKIEDIQGIENSITVQRKHIRSLKEENVLLRQRYIEKLSLTQDLKREKEAVDGTAQDLSARLAALSEELASRSANNELLDKQISDLQQLLEALSSQLQDKSLAASALEDQVAKAATRDTTLLKPDLVLNTPVPSQILASPLKSPPRYIDAIKLTRLESPEIPSPADSTHSTYSDLSAQDLLTSLNAHILSDQQLPAETATSSEDDIV